MSLTRSIIEGMWRFAVVSLGGFSVWAFAGRWFYRNVGEAGLYAVTTVAFIGLAVSLPLHESKSGRKQNFLRFSNERR